MNLSNLGRCDICGKPIDIEDADDELVISTEEDFGEEEHDISPSEAIDAMISALDTTGNTADDMVADALREDNAFRVHERCYQKTTLVWSDYE